METSDSVYVFTYEAMFLRQAIQWTSILGAVSVPMQLVYRWFA